MTNKQVANDMVGQITKALAPALMDATMDGFGSGISKEVYYGADKKGDGGPLKIVVKVVATVEKIKG